MAQLRGTLSGVSINRWWKSLPDEYYWLEATDRPDIGADLRAPQLDDAGNPNWRYNLICEVCPGDVVFHYDKNTEAIVGHSTASGTAEEHDIVWAARGTSARKRGTQPHRRPGFRLPLESFTRLDQPITLDMIREKTPELRKLVASLKVNPRTSIYFPFELSNKQPARPLQGYMFKLPADFLIHFGTGESTRAGAKAPGSPAPAKARARGQGFGGTAVRNRAVELRAMTVATDLLQRDGYKVQDVSANSPYDLLAKKRDGTLFVEVKGTTGTGETVLLTRNEVVHAQEHSAQSTLIVVAEIMLVEEGGRAVASGGVARRIEPWSPSQSALVPLSYQYAVPTTRGELHGATSWQMVASDARSVNP